MKWHAFWQNVLFSQEMLRSDSYAEEVLDFDHRYIKLLLSSTHIVSRVYYTNTRISYRLVCTNHIVSSVSFFLDSKYQNELFKFPV